MAKAVHTRQCGLPQEEADAANSQLWLPLVEEEHLQYGQHLCGVVERQDKQRLLNFTAGRDLKPNKHTTNNAPGAKYIQTHDPKMYGLGRNNQKTKEKAEDEEGRNNNNKIPDFSNSL